VRFTCNFLFMCSGYYKYEEGYTPEFAGTADFAGRIVHPQKWPEDLDYAGKRVVVIGSGATAVTLVPEMARQAAHVTMLQRSPTYVVSRPAQDPFANKLRGVPAGQARLSSDPLAQRAVGDVFLPASRRKPARVKQLILGGVGWRWGRTTTSPPISRRATIPGISGCAWCPMAICSRDQGAARSVVTNQIETFTKNRHPAEGRQRARPTSSSPRPASICRCSAAWRSASTAARSISPRR
jgi:monooxygenase